MYKIILQSFSIAQDFMYKSGDCNLSLFFLYILSLNASYMISVLKFFKMEQHLKYTFAKI